MSFRVLSALVLTYLSYQFTRQNFSFAIPHIEIACQVSKAEFGFAFFTFSICYGISKFFSGLICDTFNPRFMLIMGLFASSLVNFIIGIIGYKHNFVTLLFGLNGIFQAFGWPSIVKILNSYYTKNDVSIAWSIVSLAYPIGGFLTSLFTCYILTMLPYNWAFITPAILNFIIFFIVNYLIPNYKIPSSDKQIQNLKFKQHINNIKKLFCSGSTLWLFAVANFCVYFYRISILQWSPTLVFELTKNTIYVGHFFAFCEIFCIVGVILTGYFFNKITLVMRRYFFLWITIILFFSSIIFLLPELEFWKEIAVVISIFLSSSMHVMIGIIANDHVHKLFSATVSGLIGFFGYAGSALSGLLVGIGVEKYGWNGFFLLLVISSAILAILTIFLKKNDFHDESV